MTHITTRKICIDKNGKVCILCDECGNSKTINIAPLEDLHGSIIVRCSCGHSFRVAPERRQYYRKEVDLSGEYSSLGHDREEGRIFIHDISRTGIGFSTEMDNKLKVGDCVKVMFRLDDSPKTVVIVTVKIKRLSNGTIGAEFIRQNASLGYYLSI